MYFSPTVKPTVIDVDIYVNSIGPVSSINMVRNTCVYLGSSCASSCLQSPLDFCCSFIKQI